MRLALIVVVPLLLPLGNPLRAQAVSHVLVPIGARVKVESNGESLEGTFAGWRGDTLVVQPQGRSDTVRFMRAVVNTLRIVESPSLWRYTSPSDINFFFSTSIPRPYDLTSTSGDAWERLVLVGAKTELTALDAETGAVRWSRKDLGGIKRAALDLAWSSGFAIVTRHDTMEVFDLRTGAKRWDTGALSIAAASGWLPSPGADTAILVLGNTAQSPTALLAVDLASGKVRWRQDSAFTAPPKVFATSGISYLLGHQSPMVASDTSFVLYISTDGPIALDLRTGQVLWRGTALRGAKLPLPEDGYARIVNRRGLFYLPSGNGVLALRGSDGAAGWSSAHQFKKQVFRIQPTPRGLLTRGYEWFDLLDPATGKSVWHAPLEVKNATWDIARGDTDYVASEKNVMAINVADGSLRTIAPFELKENERPAGFAVWRPGIFLYSWHNVLMVDRKGKLVYQREYPSPKAGFGELINPTVTDIMRPTTRWAGTHIFFFTDRADDQGREGFCVVEVDPNDGHEAGRLWFPGRNPGYMIDPEIGVTFYRRSETTLDALPLLDGTDVAYAARNGYLRTIERLTAMGVNTAEGQDEGGWTALHLAAVADHPDIARFLLDHGARPQAVTRAGWKPWMLAWRERHDSLAQALRAGMDADTASAAAGAANSWRWARQGRIAESVAELQRAMALDSTLTLWPDVMQIVCWNGSFAGQAAAVLAVCDHAVNRSTPDDDYFESAHTARAVARALTGNLDGAAADLEVNEARQDESGSYGRWLATLHQGRNPFTPVVLERMRQ